MSRYLVFALVCAVSLMASIATTAIAVAFPVIVSEFNASLVLAGWVLSVNQLVSTAVMPLAGKVSDAFGRKRTFMVLLGVFMAGSLFCAIAPNIQLLILSRVVQAIGSGGFMPSATGIVADQFPGSRRQALGFLTTVMPIGQIIGPVFGGLVTQSLGWRAVFWVNLPLGILGLAALAWMLPSGEREESRIDLVGAGLFASMLGTFMIGLSSVGNRGGGLQGLSTWVLLGASAALMVVFLRHEGRVKNPIIDVDVISRGPFLAANIFNFIYGACIHGVAALIPLYAVTVYGMSTFDSGFILTPKSIGMMLAASVTSIFLVRWGYRRPMLTGAVLIASSLWLLGSGPSVTGFPGIEAGGTAILVATMAVMGLGMGVTGPAANNACIELMPHRIATISGIRGMFRQSGGAVAITIASILLQNQGDITDAFRIIFFGMAAVIIMAIPFVLIMTRDGLPPDREQPIPVNPAMD